MARVIPAALLAHLRGDTTSIARIMSITRRDGKIVRLTDASSDVTFEGFPYYSDPGFTCSAVYSSTMGGRSQGLEIQMVLNTSLLNAEDVYNRMFEGQPCIVTVLNYKVPGDGGCVLSRGPVGRIRFTEKGRASFEMLPLLNDSAMVAEDVFSQTCRASLGDAKCGFNIDDYRVEFTVTEVVSDFAFRVDTLAGRADDFFAWGQVGFDTGDNEGTTVDVRSSNKNSIELRLWTPLRMPLVVGDEGHVWPGCDKLPTTCNGKFANLANFRGEYLSPQWTAL